MECIFKTTTKLLTYVLNCFFIQQEGLAWAGSDVKARCYGVLHLRIKTGEFVELL